MKIKIVCLCVLMGSFLMFADNSSIKIGWAEANITPDEPVLLQGQFHARVSEGVKNPIMATVMALNQPPLVLRGSLRSAVILFPS